MSEEFEDTKGVIKNCKSKKDRQHNGLPEYLSSPPVFSGVRVTRSLVLCVMFCRSLFVLLSVFFRPLCCLSFFDLQFLITPLVSSNSSDIDFVVYYVSLFAIIKLQF
jgi:hypothetical protein